MDYLSNERRRGMQHPRPAARRSPRGVSIPLAFDSTSLDVDLSPAAGRPCRDVFIFRPRLRGDSFVPNDVFGNSRELISYKNSNFPRASGRIDDCDCSTVLSLIRSKKDLSEECISVYGEWV
ncbi:hypothetical protein EVAR_44646_1 [Eumeta japonica]|uniref:Uncharacterized protein n=1 Tax=Eumeta variegata TaxID=151549 RepID=A0A4C1XFP3_EUMVA|nr:hypothetical protein EVAR_44646_1 [Eumeta japonica]